MTTFDSPWRQSSSVGPSIAAPPQPGGEEVVGYYGKPIVKAHVWKDTIGWYFFTGGLAGASSVLAAAAELAGQPTLARHARRAALLGLLPSPPLLIADLGRPGRFLNMLRVFKPTSPMSVGSWVLSAYSAASLGSLALGELGRARRLQRAASVIAAPLGSAMATYTAVLLTDTATPVWHAARTQLPWVFAGSAAASAGAATTLLATLSGTASPAAVYTAAAGASCEIGAHRWMTHRLGPLDTYRTDASARRFSRAATALSGAGTVVLATQSRRRGAAIGGALAVLAGSFCQRMAVLRAGTASANDPRSVHGVGADPH